MRGREGIGDSRIYIIIAVFILAVVIITFILSSNTLTSAYVPDMILDNGWSENLEERDSGSTFFGLEKWSSITYDNDNERYPAFLSVISKKSLILMNEEELSELALSTIENAIQENMIIDYNSLNSGERVTNNSHQTNFFIYDCIDNSSNSSELIKIIGEVWNCGNSGSSIICIGFAQITDNEHNNTEINTLYWNKIIRDSEGTFGFGDLQNNDGIIFNIICH